MALSLRDTDLLRKYFADKPVIVWQIAQNDLPVLKNQFSKVLIEFVDR